MSLLRRARLCREAPKFMEWWWLIGVDVDSLFDEQQFRTVCKLWRHWTVSISCNPVHDHLQICWLAKSFLQYVVQRGNHVLGHCFYLCLRSCPCWHNLILTWCVIPIFLHEMTALFWVGYELRYLLAAALSKATLSLWELGPYASEVS